MEMWSKIDPVLRFSPTRFWRTAAAPSFRNLSAEIVRRDAALKTPCILETAFSLSLSRKPASKSSCRVLGRGLVHEGPVPQRLRFENRRWVGRSPFH
jgi:hypothetical protein